MAGVCSSITGNGSPRWQVKDSAMKFGKAMLFFFMVLPHNAELAPAADKRCTKTRLFKAQNVVAWSTRSNVRNFLYRSGLAIDADGAIRGYHPDDRLGLDS